ncbi:MAG: diguanylate cyclase, partial [Cyanobacteria bacterium J083]
MFEQILKQNIDKSSNKAQLADQSEISPPTKSTSEAELKDQIKLLELEKTQLQSELEDLRQKALRFGQIVDNISEVLFMISAQTNEIMYISPAYEQVWGRTRESLYQDPQSWLKAIHPEDCFEALATLETQFRTGEEFHEEYRIIRPDESFCWVKVRAFPVRDAEGEVDRFVGIAEDITERKEAEAALRKSEEQFRLTFELAPIGMVITSLDNQIERVNHSLAQALNYPEAELLNLNFADICHPADYKQIIRLEQDLITGKKSSFQIENRHLGKNGQIVDTILKVLIVRDAQGNPLHFNKQIVDIRERKIMERQLLHDASHDSLTGLANRTLFLQRLQEQIDKRRNNLQYKFAVLFLDLDRFKLVNDSMGHEIGDKLLVAIAKRLEKCVRPIDTVARLGGDEFTILLEDIQDLLEATKIAERIDDALTSPFLLDGYELFSSTSIGIAISNDSYQAPEDILRDADLSMYSAKEQGKARYEIFVESMRDQAVTRLELETDLRKALEREEFVIYYQPITFLSTGALTGFEALIRWQHPQRGLVSPTEFIPIMEETGMIIHLGNWMLWEICTQLKQWQVKYPQHKDLKVSINLSGRQLKEPNFLQY